MLQLCIIKQNQYSQRASKIQLLQNWVVATVEPQRLQLASMGASSDGTLTTLLKELKKDLCPSDDDWKEQVLQRYREVLASSTRASADQWILDWSRAYANAKIVDLQEIKGVLAIKEFLRAARAYQPEWAQRELDELARPGAANKLSLDDYSHWFKQLWATRESRSDGAYATLGGRSDGHYRCPCRRGDYRWEPIECARLEFALRGSTDRELRFKPTTEEIKVIEQRLRAQEFKQLRKDLVEKGWISSDLGIQYPGSIEA